MFKNIEGQRVPNVTFKTRRDHEWVDLTSDDIFAGKNVIVFSLPGAFTPTCSSSHVPRYNQLQPWFKANGIDEVICMSVNDAFVMSEWALTQNADRVTFLPDGNGEFTDGMGLLVGKEDLGFGKRSWRYSMLVRDGVIEKMFIEPQEPGDPSDTWNGSPGSCGSRRCSSSHRSRVTRSTCRTRTRCSSTLPRMQRSHTTLRSSRVPAARSARRQRACCATPASSSRSWF